MARNRNAEQRQEEARQREAEARQREEDRDRWKTMELGIIEIQNAINGERGIVSRQDNHAKRLKHVEDVILVGGFVLSGAGAALFFAKDLIIEWARKKMGLA